MKKRVQSLYVYTYLVNKADSDSDMQGLETLPVIVNVRVCICLSVLDWQPGNFAHPPCS